MSLLQVLENIMLRLSYDDVVSMNLVCRRISQVICESGRIWKHLLWKVYPGISFLQYCHNTITKTNRKQPSSNSNADLMPPNKVKQPENIQLKKHGTENCQNKTIDTATSDTATEIVSADSSSYQTYTNHWKNKFDVRRSIGSRAEQWVAR